MLAIVDYGVGNLFSLASSLAAIGEAAVPTGDVSAIRRADKLILPGVGAFGDAADKLKNSGLFCEVQKAALQGKPILGICLGMQLLFEKSYEYGTHEGLGLLRGEIRPVADVIAPHLKIPHIGWNSLHLCRPSRLFRFIQEGDFVYFVHSYYAACCEESTTATTDYSVPLTACVERDNVFGCQFHPEKSGKVGLAILRAFCAMEA